jgi:hypothetical protein
VQEKRSFKRLVQQAPLIQTEYCANQGGAFSLARQTLVNKGKAVGIVGVSTGTYVGFSIRFEKLLKQQTQMERC